jgi:hypothetical protein
LAGEAGLGEANLAQIEIRGERIESVAHPFIPYAEAAKARFGAVRIIEANTCTGCMGEMESTFLYLNEAGYGEQLKDLTLILGTPDEVPPMMRTPVIVGKCPRQYRDLGVWVPGCPPHGIKIADAICEALDLDKVRVHETIERLHQG